MNVKPEECVIVEDNENGVKSAKASGAHVMVVKEPKEVTYENVKHFINKVQRIKL